MNYLAHCYLSCSEEDILIGNFMTDFLKKKEESNYTGRVLDGIQLHRSIDTFTDKHPASLELRALLRKRHGKYASVVVDLIWDYYLSTNWDKFSAKPLPDFNQNIYEILTKRKDELPEKLNQKIDKMINNDFLMAYASETNMLHSLQWMDKRVNFKSAFHEAIIDVKENKDLFQKLFMEFFPELISHSETHCQC